MIEEIYKDLKKQKKCNSGYQFSREFLGKSNSYYSVLKARKEEPTLDVITVLEYVLDNQNDVNDIKAKVTTLKEEKIKQILSSVNSEA